MDFTYERNTWIILRNMIVSACYGKCCDNLREVCFILFVVSMYQMISTTILPEQSIFGVNISLFSFTMQLLGVQFLSYTGIWYIYYELFTCTTTKL
jgi:hypothetical protein